MELHYKLEGAQNPAIIILHGLFGMSDNWRSIARQLADHHCVYAIDLPNHGRSPWLPSYDLSSVAKVVGDFIDSLSIEHYCLIGHSLGGKVAMNMALSHDYPIDQLIVVDIAPKLYTPGHDAVFRALRHTDLTDISRRSEADARMAAYMDDIGVRQFLLKSLYRQEGGTYGWRFDLDTLERDYTEILHPIRAPYGTYDEGTLFIRGGKSRYVLDEDMDSIHDLFPQADLITIADAGHWVHAEQPEAFVSAVREALMTD